MRRLLILLCIVIAAQHNSFAQADTAQKPKIYNPAADAEKDINDAVAKARKENKHVLLQIGGNWCIWCIRFHNLVNSDDTLKQLMAANYVVVHVNYSPENHNKAILAKLDYPQRFGFPVFVVLDAKGKRIHTQDSGYLEENKGHSKKKVADFLKKWSPDALKPENYLKD